MKTENAWQKPPFYIAVLLYESASDAPNDPPLYEETFVLIEANTEEEATAKALKLAQNPFSYKNQYGATITWTFKQLVAILSMVTGKIGDGEELCARHFYNYNAYRQAFLEQL